MNHKTKNIYKIYFKDGTCFNSSGSSSSIKKSTLKNEFEWVSFHIQKEVRLSGKALEDIKKVEYTLNYIENE